MIRLRLSLIFLVKFAFTTCVGIGTHYLDFPESADWLCNTHNHEVYIYLHPQDHSAKIVKATNTDQYQTSTKECHIYVRPERGYGVMAYVTRINLRTTKFNKCEDYVKIWGYRGPFTGKATGEICVKEGAQLATHDNGQPLVITFYRKQMYKQNSTVHNHNFEIVLTLYSKSYEEDTFQCSNGRNIWSALTCDGKNNCGDGSDEMCWGKTNIGSLVGAIIGGLLVIFVIVGICYCLRKRHLSHSTSVSTLYSNYNYPTPLESTVVVPLPDPSYSPLPQEYPQEHPLFRYPTSDREKT